MCYNKIENQNAVNLNDMVSFTAHGFLSKGLITTSTNNTFIADSVAICHMISSVEGLFNL
jgi:hypothetical protein